MVDKVVGISSSEEDMILSEKIEADGDQSICPMCGEDLSIEAIECPKCGNNVAYVWQVQTRSADESSTQFLRCTKCSHTVREYT